ncbi:MAG: pilus assembly protein PilM [Tenericutes bacterium]|jgi:hypothetical protein|nr:pilus assembly protein PilM [Mycoplasmatota bacterium]
MKKDKNPLSLFITDNGIAFFGGTLGEEDNKTKFGQEKLPIKVIENGYIKEPEMLLHRLRVMWKHHNIKPKFIRFVVQDQNILTREFSVKKSELKRKSIKDYFNEQINKKFHVPFDKTIISYQIRAETEDDYSVLLYIADENLLQDYYDVLEKLGVNDIVFDLAVSALMEITDIEHKYKEKNVMMVSLYDHLLSIQIVEKNQLVFGIIEEYDGNRENYFTQFEIYCERVANYYQYNMRSGNEQIDNAIIFNLKEVLDSKDVKDYMLPKISHLNAELFSIKNYDKLFETTPRGVVVAYASNEILLNREKNEKIIDFKLKRLNYLKILGYYIIILALAIFTSISVIYLPYYETRETIIDQQYINESLIVTKNRIEKNISEDNILVLPIEYINTYELITENQALLPVNEFQDLEDALFGNIEIVNFDISVQDQTIILTIEGDTTHECLDYILNIYEVYGITDTSSDDAWMVSEPTENIISDSIVEVTIYYA